MFFSVFLKVLLFVELHVHNNTSRFRIFILKTEFSQWSDLIKIGEKQTITVYTIIIISLVSFSTQKRVDTSKQDISYSTIL